VNKFRAVHGSREISKRIADYLELDDPANYHPKDRAKTVRDINDTLQGRSSRLLSHLLTELEAKIGQSHPVACADIHKQIQDFLYQKELLAQTYSKRSDEVLPFETHDFGCRRLKIIDQRHFDYSAEIGFPPDFFRHAFFDHVTLYCLPEGADFFGSTLQNCEFEVCGIRNASFFSASIFSTEFHSSVLRDTSFCDTTFVHSHFYDCELSRISFQSAYLKSCSMIDCLLHNAQFTNATLNACSFGRLKPSQILDLHTAKITQSGATEEECRANRTAVLRAFGTENE